jgi:hypothetical protein
MSKPAIARNQVTKSIFLRSEHFRDGTDGVNGVNGANGARGVLGRGRLAARGPD